MSNLPRIITSIKGRLLKRPWKKISSDGKNELFDESNPVNILSNIKLRQTIPEIFSITKSLTRDNKFSELIRPSDKPSSYESIRTEPFLHQGTLAAELAWNAGIIAGVNKRILSFLSLKKKYYKAFIFGDYTSCRSIVTEIIQEHGYSIWILEKQIILADRIDGFKAHKQFVSDIYQNDKIPGEIRLMTYFYSSSAEENLSFSKLCTLVDDFILERKIDHIVSNYVKFKCIPDFKWLPKLAIDLLMFESISSPIDRYCTFSKIVLSLSSTNNRDLCNEIYRILSMYRQSIDDDSFDQVLMHLGSHTGFTKSDNGQLFISALDNYTTGNYNESVSLCEKSDEYESVLEFEHLKVRSYISIASGQEIRQPIPLVASYIKEISEPSQTGNIFRSAEDFLKYLCAFSSDPFCYVGVGIIYRYLKILKSGPVDFICRGIFSSKLPNPFLMFCNSIIINPASFKRRTEAIYANSITVDLFYAVITGDVPRDFFRSIPSHRVDKYVAISDAMHHKNEHCLAKICELERSNNPDLSVHVLTVIKVDQIIKLDKFQLAAKTVAEYCVRNPFLVCAFSVLDIIDGLERNQRSNLGGELALPVFFEMASKVLPNLKHNYKHESYDDYMNRYNNCRPSELPDNLGPLLVPFFRNVCIRSVLELSSTFKTDIAVEKERLDLCRRLITLDPEREEEYQREIKEISHTLMLIESGRAYASGKLFVNETGIRKATEREVKGGFTRLERFKDAGIRASGEEIEISLTGPNGKVSQIAIPADAIDTIEINIIDDIINNFLFSIEYGLDSYLSIRIRHQVLSGALRGPLERLHLITHHDGKGHYSENEYWKDKFSIDEEDWGKINTSLSRFSGLVDALIVDLKTNWLRIQSKYELTHPGSRLDLSLSKEQNETARLIVQTSPSTDTLYTDIFSLMWNILENKLEALRRELLSSVVDQFILYLDELGNSITIDHQAHQLIKADIASAKAQIRQAIEQVVKWLHRVGSHEIVKFTVVGVLEVARGMVNRHHPDIEVTFNHGLPEGMEINGRFLAFFIDIFTTIFENVAANGHDAKVNINIVSSGSHITIKMVNGIKIDSLEECIRKVTSIKSLIQNTGGRMMSRNEGNSGLAKVKKIIDVDIMDNTTDGKFDFEIKDGNFHCEISIPKERIKAI